MSATRSLTCRTDRQIVGDEDVGEAELLLQVGEQVEDLGLDRDVQGRDRLVADDQLRLERQGPGHADPLPLPAGELSREPVVVLGLSPTSSITSWTRRLRSSPRATPWMANGSPMIEPDPALRVERAVRVLEDHLHLAAHRADLARTEPA